MQQQRSRHSSSDSMKYPSRINIWSMLLLLLIVTNVAAQGKHCSTCILKLDVSAVEYCNEFVNRGNLIISDTVRTAVEEGQFTFQELIDCLQDRDSLTFEVSTLTLETLNISHAITIRSTPEASTSLSCLDGPIFIIE